MPNRTEQIEAIIRHKDQLFRQLGESIDMVFWLRAIDDGEIFYLSPTANRLSGLPDNGAKPTTQGWMALVHPDDRAATQAMDTRRGQRYCNSEYRIIRPDGEIRWIQDQSSPIRDSSGQVSCIAGVVHDISARKHDETQIRILNQLYAALSHTNQALNACTDESTLFDRVCRIAVELGGMTLAWIGTVDPATQRIVPVARYGQHQTYLDGLVISAQASVPEGRGPTGTAFRETRPVFIQDFSTADLTSLWHERAKPYGWRASAAVGFKRAGKPYAVLTLYHNAPHPFDEKTVGLLVEMATNLGHGLDQLDINAARQRSEAQLRATSQLYHDILETSIDGFCLFDTQGRILEINGAYLRRSGYTREQLLDLHIHELDGLENAAQVESRIRRLGSEGAIQFETMHRARDGSLWPVEVKAVALTSGAGAGFAFLRDLSERKRAEEEIISLGFYDPLTNLPNRRLLLDRLRHAMANSSRSLQYCAVLFIDLDHFKVINDTAGHETGDLLLQEVTLRLNTLVREQDTVARLGGDEFVILLEELDPDIHRAMTRARAAGDKLLQSFARPYLLNGEEYNCTASIGVVIFRDHDTSMEDILKHSDLAMYGAKKSGRNTLRFFDPLMQQELERRTRTETELRRSLNEKQLRIYCQKQVDASGAVCGAELLLRWQHPERGLVPPLEFIPLAEESGLIIPIGQWLLRETCLQLKRWESNPATRDLMLSVNVSAREFRHTDFVDNVRAILAETGANPRRLELEITESLLLEGIDEFILKMRVMKEMGIAFSMDDFGTGYSSLSYLKKLPLNQLKIDRSFVQDLGQDRSDEAIVQTIIRMSETLGLNVIAEGVETETQRDMLLHYGCRQYQGYLFGRPEPLEDFVAHLQDKRAASLN